MLKLKNSNLSSTSFSTPFLLSHKCPTMPPHQEAMASSTSSLASSRHPRGLKEFTTVVDSPTRPWSSLSCFEDTPSKTSLNTMKEWYSENGLEMNSYLTEYNMFATPNFVKRTETFQITIDDTVSIWKIKSKSLGDIRQASFF